MPRAGVLWLGAVTTLLGGLGACGDGDGDDAPNGTGGSKVSGGSSGATPNGGSGASTGGAGGMPSNAGEGGTPGEGGNGPVAGSPGGGDAGSGTVAGSPNAGESGSGQAGGAGGSDGSAAGSGGGAEVPVEYRSCDTGAPVTRLELYRIDRAQQTCTMVVIQQGQIDCLEGLTSGGWCVIRAALASDIEACERLEAPSDQVQASASVGTFTISTQPPVINIDVDFEFPANSGLPESVSVEANDCLADCVLNDCRP